MVFGRLFGRKRIYQEENKAIRIAPKHNNSFKNFPYAIQKHLAVCYSDFASHVQLKVSVREPNSENCLDLIFADPLVRKLSLYQI